MLQKLFTSVPTALAYFNLPKFVGQILLNVNRHFVTGKNRPKGNCTKGKMTKNTFYWTLPFKKGKLAKHECGITGSEFIAFISRHFVLFLMSQTWPLFCLFFGLFNKIIQFLQQISVKIFFHLTRVEEVKGPRMNLLFCLFFKNGPTPASFCFFLFFSITILQ